MNLARAIATVGGFTLLSRLTGFARDMLIAGLLGAGMVSDAFFVAFKFPNLFRRLFAEGAFNAAFVPLFSGRLENEGQVAAQRFAEEALSILLAALLIFVALMQAVMPWAMLAFAPGFTANPEKFDLAVTLSRLTFPYLLLVSLVSLLAGVLNSLGKFAAAAAAPIILNLGLMASLLGLASFLPTPGHALALGTSLSGLLQVIWLFMACRIAGMNLRLLRPRLSPDIVLLLKRILPGAIGAGAYQVNLIIDTIVASLLAEGAVSYLYYADRINQLPLGVVGIAVGTALLPLMSRQLRAGETEAAMHSQNRAIEFALLLTLPAMTALAALAYPIVVVLFERGAFGPEASRATGTILSFLALGLPAYVLVKALTPAFFAREDTATPVKIGMATMGVNAVLTAAFAYFFGYIGIALATAIAAWLNAGALFLISRRRGFLVLDAQLKRRGPRILFASALMGITVYGAAYFAAPWLSGPLWLKGASLAGLVGLGLGLFAILAPLLGAASFSDLRGALKPRSAKER
jgi:putative peptidoglycan lipid II flippase